MIYYTKIYKRHSKFYNEQALLLKNSSHGNLNSSLKKLIQIWKKTMPPPQILTKRHGQTQRDNLPDCISKLHDRRQDKVRRGKK